jgi:hypothetical protein
MLAGDCDHLAANLRWWLWWSFADYQWLRGAGAWRLLTDYERRRWRGLNITLLFDQNLAFYLIIFINNPINF